MRLPQLLIAFVAALGLLALSCAEEEPVAFTHGVASGDVRPDGAVLWTRADRAAKLTLEVAEDEAFAQIVVEEGVSAEEERDFTAKAEIAALEPKTTYYYRFRRGDSSSDVGSFRTAPAADDAAPVRFVFSGDSDGTVRDDGTRAFDFRVLDTARAEEPDFFLYLGDTIYADSGFGPKAETLDAYREKYKENREVEPLRGILAATSVYAIWDDHEVENNFEGTTVDPNLLAAGRQAFREYMPLSGDDRPDVLYRRFRWGKALELIILDERTFRDDDVERACTLEGAEDPDLLPGLGAPGVPPEVRSLRQAVGLPPETAPDCLAALNDPGRTLLGAEQLAFLQEALQESDATFKLIVNEVPISEYFGQPYDRWEGYRAERDKLLRFIGEQQIRNVVFLTTDFHANIVSPVRLNLSSPPVAQEFVTGPIAHETLGDSIVRNQREGLVEAFKGLLTSVAGATCVELDAFSYGLVEVDPAAGTATVTLKDEAGKELCRSLLRAQ